MVSPPQFGSGGPVTPESELAQRHGAGVERETHEPRGVHARFPKFEERRPEYWAQLPARAWRLAAADFRGVAPVVVLCGPWGLFSP